MCPNGVVCPAGEQCAATQPICIKTTCGNGTKDTNEACDDGNIANGTCPDGSFCNTNSDCGGLACKLDSCSSDCTSDQTCGNGITDPGEVCDDGSGNGVDGHCSTGCALEGCGNDVKDPGEACDDGNTFNGACGGSGGSGCNSDADCGGGSGTCVSDGCSSSCQFERCGDGIKDPGEACDDGNTFNGTCGGAGGSACNFDADCGGSIKCVVDGCNSTCTSNESCGNGTVDLDEICDDGNTANGACPDGTPCNSNTDCGGDTCTPDACAHDCQSNQTCGNGILDLGEKCDNGSANGPGQACETDCQGGSGCGNGVLDPGELCDDGNANDNDDCPSGSDLPEDERCVPARCGDGIVDNSGSGTHTLFEQCDPGSAGQTAECNINCTIPKCGDGVFNPLAFVTDGSGSAILGSNGAPLHEQCDNGGSNSDNADCTSLCQLNVCGDHLIDTIGPTHVEQCDLGSANGSGSAGAGGCDLSCQEVSCGNGILETGEECDLGSAITNDLNGPCPSCRVATCGDGHIETGVEQCDNGSSADGSNGTCPFCRNAFCGDGFHETVGSAEQCDHGGSNGSVGDLCDSECKTVGCNNGVIDWNEQCDFVGGSAIFVGGATCSTLGYGSGTLGCNSSSCQFVISGNCASFCGNGIAEAGEQCDGSDLGSATCGSLGFQPGSGSLTCYPSGNPAQCELDTQSCVAFQTCGDNHAEGTEQCDGTDLRGLSCAFFGFDGTGSLACGSAGAGSSACKLNASDCNQCSDGTEDDGETDQDCGGPCGATCTNGDHCEHDTDCVSEQCASSGRHFHTCIGDHCSDGSKDNDETDVDCGGPTCDGEGDTCSSGLVCSGSGDCASGICLSGSPKTCGCGSDGDCASGWCDTSTHACTATSCTDQTKDSGETDVDCGGPCSKCATGSDCLVNADCTSGFCDPSFKCVAALCGDGFLESGEECDKTGPVYPNVGGTQESCATFGYTGGSLACSSSCAVDVSGCVGYHCANGVKDPGEADVDCGGSCPDKCAIGDSCGSDADCESDACGSGSGSGTCGSGT